MRYLWVLVFVLLAGSAEATTRYASNTGTGASPCTTISPAASRCSVATMFGALVAGDTGQLLGGSMTSPATYQGANYMLTPAAGKSGTAGNPITVQCADIAGSASAGGCLVDGQFVRIPFNFPQNSYWIVEDINFKSSSGSVIRIGNSPTQTSSHNIIRRVVAWDAIIWKNAHVTTILYGSTNNLFEDFAAFGTGRKVFASGFSSGALGVGNGTTCRRCWFRWEGSIQSGNKMAYTHNYNSTGNTCENCVATFDGISQPQTYREYNGTTPATSPQCGSDPCTNYAIPAAEGAISRDHSEDFPCTNSYLVGSLGYVLPTAYWKGNQVVAQSHGSCFTVADVMGFMPETTNPPIGSSQTATTVAGMKLEDGNQPSGNTTNVASHVTAVSPRLPALTATSPWILDSTVTSYQYGAPSSTFSASTGYLGASITSPWTNTGAGANLCYQYVDRVRSSTPLWPWPMNDRILAATGQAGAYPVNATTCPTCAGTAPRSRTPTNVTSDIESILGTIPAACRSDSQGGGFPAFTGYPTHGQITSFSAGSSTSPPVGFVTLSGSDWVESGGVATAGASFGITLYNTAQNPNQEAWSELTTLPAATGDFGINFLVVDIDNRYRAVLTPVTGTNNDTIIVTRRENATNTVLATVSLGRDMAVADRLGIRVTDSVIDIGYYTNWSGTTEWRKVGTTTATSSPSQSFIGMGAFTPTAVTQFGGGSDPLVDNQPPSAPANLSVTPQGVVAIDLEFDDSTDNVAVTEYRIYRGIVSNCSDCVVIGTNTVSNFTDSSASPGLTYYYRVTARDAALNESSASSIVAGRVPDGPAYAEGSGRLR